MYTDNNPVNYIDLTGEKRINENSSNMDGGLRLKGALSAKNPKSSSSSKLKKIKNQETLWHIKTGS